MKRLLFHIRFLLCAFVGHTRRVKSGSDWFCSRCMDDLLKTNTVSLRDAMRVFAGASNVKIKVKP